MPGIKSTSQKTAVQRQEPPAGPTPSHSRHSQLRSKDYHDRVVGIFKGPAQMTQARSQTFRDDEDWDE